MQMSLISSISDPVFNPWDDPKSQNWFNGGTKIPEVGIQEEKLIPLQESRTSIPVVGKSLNYVPPWMIEYSRHSYPYRGGQTSDTTVKKFPGSELSVSNRDKNASYGVFPAIPLSFPPFAGNFEKPHNWNVSAGTSDDITERSSKTPPGSRVDQDAGKMFFTTGRYIFLHKNFLMVFVRFRQQFCIGYRTSKLLGSGLWILANTHSK